jgi:Fic family protein
MQYRSNLFISPEMANLLAQIDEFKGSWQLLGRISPDILNTLRKVATIESIGSSTRIEGSKLSDQDVEKLLSRINRKSFVSRDEEEVAGYAFVCEEVFTSYDAMPLTENVIKQLHGWLLQFSHKDERHRGDYKKFPNHVEAFDADGKSLGVIFETTSPFETPAKMQELVYWTREQLETKALHPLLAIAIFIIEFLTIHPFQDGNGRLSRILTTLLLLKSGYAYVPYSSLESIIERNKEGYYLALRKTQQSFKTAQPDYSPWLLFFLRSLQKQKDHLAQKISREKLLIADLAPLSSQILSLISERGHTSIRDLVQLTGANRSTLKKNVTYLVKTKRIIQLGKGRATTYALA